MASLYKIIIAIIGILPLLFAVATGITTPNVTNILWVRRVRQPPNSTSTYHHNAGLLKNAAGLPFELEYADPEQKVIKSFGSNYNFTDLFTLDYFFSQADEPSLRDGPYYAFTDSNIDASQHAMFYALWSILRQDTPDFKKYGEWGAFAAEYMDTYNSRCGHDDSHCSDVPSLEELKRMYPNQRPKVRLIYFTTMKMTMFHDMQVAIEKHIHRVHTNLVTRIPTLVETFAHQPDANKLKLCEFAHKAVEIVADISVRIALMGIASSIPAGATSIELVFDSKEIISEAIKSTWKLKPEMFQTGKNFVQGEWEAWYNGFNLIEDTVRDSIKHLEPKTFTFDPWAFASPQLYGWSTKAFHFVNDKLAKDLGFDQGYNVGHLCGAWEGDDRNRSPENIRRIQEYLSTYFGLLERGTREQYGEMYTGMIIAPGQPTLMALYGMNLKWSGEGSILETLKDMEPLKE